MTSTTITLTDNDWDEILNVFEQLQTKEYQSIFKKIHSQVYPNDKLVEAKYT